MRLREGGGAEPRRFTASQWRPVSLLAHITAIFTHVIAILAHVTAILPAHVIGSSHGSQRLSDRQTGAASFRLLDRRRRQDHRGSHRHRPRWPFHPLQVAGHVQSHGSLPRHGVPSHNGELDGSQRRSESGSRLHDHCRTDIADSMLESSPCVENRRRRRFTCRILQRWKWTGLNKRNVGFPNPEAVLFLRVRPRNSFAPNFRLLRIRGR